MQAKPWGLIWLMIYTTDKGVWFFPITGLSAIAPSSNKSLTTDS